MNQAEQKASGGVWARIGITAVILIALAVAGVVGILTFVESERERELRSWQVRMGIVTASRAAAVERWLVAQMDEVRGLADNPSVPLYATQILLAREGPEGPSPEAEYLSNLLTVSAARAGYDAAPTGPDVEANVERQGVAGLAMIDMEGRPLVSTSYFPAIDREMRNWLSEAPRGEPLVRDMYQGPGGHPTMAFLAPVFPIQGDRVPEQQIGWVVGIKPIGDELYPLLDQPGDTQRSAEAVLVRADGAVIEYLSPLADGTAPFELTLARNTPELSAAAAIDSTGGFGIGRDYRDEPVLYTSRAVSGVDWALLYKIDRAEALADSERRLRQLLIGLLLGLGALVAALFGLWRHGASLRASAAADRFQQMAERFEAQRDLLRLVSDSQPASIAIIDDAGAYRFANARAALRAGVEKADMVGKTLAAIFGPERAKPYERLNREALEEGEVQTAVHRFEEEAGTQVVETQHIPLAATADTPRGVLMVEEDITGQVIERERRERNLRQVVRTLVSVVDRRDPNAAHHSTRVAEVARAVAEEMGLDAVSVETASFAGQLLNLGKILVPEEILTKSGKLSEDEYRRVRESLLASADLLEGIEFDGPVVQTLRQSQERWDGTGPDGVQGEGIIVTARVVAVANAFVAMVSPRAHRPGMDFDAAIETLMGEAGKAFDRRVVAALVGHLDNRGGREAWAEFQNPVPGL